MPFFSRSNDLAPLIVVRTVDRERTIGIYVVIEERETERMFVGRQITVKGGAERLAPGRVMTREERDILVQAPDGEYRVRPDGAHSHR